MPVFHEHRAIFLHIGKTAGVAIERGLGLPACDYREYQPDRVYGVHKGVMTQHATPDYIQQLISPDVWQDYFKFTIVRNPWDRMVSAYYYLYNINKEKFGDFSSWLISMHGQVMDKSYRVGSHVTPQIEYTHDQDNNEQILDYVGRYESLPDSYQHICYKLNIPYNELQVLNPSGKRKTKDYKTMYNNFTMNLVKQMYGTEIEMFDYQF